MSPSELCLCLELGLLRPADGREGTYELTRAGRCLLGDLRRPETSAEWNLRVEGAQQRGGRP